MLTVEQIAPRRIIPVVVIEDYLLATPLRGALIGGGLQCAEITCRTSAAIEAITAMAEDPDFLVGAGTVTTADQVERVVRAGARFVVCPGLSAAVVRACADAGVTCVPGTVTATEVMRAVELGVTTVKFFPAETNGGLAAITALGGPFPDVRFVPTGGIRLSSLGTYLASQAVAAVGGTWLTPLEAQRSGDFASIERLVAEAMAVAEDAA
ncbi:MAG: 2-dehydro-3-deoxyphosphogluconate aldolase / (4S)-4-hydroxy-2-oxoglutarate aldolase [Actinomycetota bacterium]|jgi:2-dehydro-3-deoxyphosphogluconate aldolase/(4S)-4-hydroxy-2-oxoglutarate aldolase|nr:2-dehydro-3-deoxyphosphogluconate aldolase / (4S)-4-hydroxy-2-oxoglutarate aldolase [Actinomycetota bacterium]